MTAPLFSDLSLSAQTNFAELVEQASAQMLARSIGDVPGSFNRKTVRGGDYWYWQWKDLGGRTQQVYLGPDGDRLRSLIEKKKTEGSGDAHQVAALARACASLGCMTMVPDHFKVIRRIADQGFFRAGGILVGTHAFIAMGNMLGVRWKSGLVTNDIDFAHPGRNVSLGVQDAIRIDVHDAITSLEMGLLPAKSITTGVGATYFNESRELRIDFLTAMSRSADVYRHEGLNVNLEPLKFMEFSLEKTAQTVALGGEDAVVVNIPSPMRYALHKLLVMAERQDQFQMKIRKDAGQVAALLEYGLARSPRALREAVADIMGRGPGWRSRVQDGLRHLVAHHPQTARELAPLLKVRASRGDRAS